MTVKRPPQKSQNFYSEQTDRKFLKIQFTIGDKANTGGRPVYQVKTSRVNVTVIYFSKAFLYTVHCCPSRERPAGLGENSETI